MDRPLHFTKLRMEEFKEARFETIGQLNQTLRHADNLVTCRGCETSPTTKPTNVSFRDNQGLLRHLKCPLIITDGTQYVWCKHVVIFLSLYMYVVALFVYVHNFTSIYYEQSQYMYIVYMRL